MFEKKRGTRFLASVMALVMLLSLAPVGALATEGEGQPAENQPVAQSAVDTKDTNENTPTEPDKDSDSAEATKPEGDFDESFSYADADTSDNDNGIAAQNLSLNAPAQEQSITAEYWVTNSRVTANDETSMTINASDSRIESEAGASVESLAPGSGTRDSNIAVFWQARVLPNDEQQTTVNDVDRTAAGKKIQAVRYYDSSFWYQEDSTNQWTKFTTKRGNIQEQLVFYYLIKTDFEKNISVYVTDWPLMNSSLIPNDARSPHQVNYEVLELPSADAELTSATKLGKTVSTYYNKAFTISAIKVGMNENQQYYIRNITITSTKGNYDNPSVNNSEAEFSLNLKTAGEDWNLSSNGVITIKIYVTAYKYELAYEKNGGTINDSSYSQAGYYFPEDSIIAPTNVTKTGYTFAGWYTDEACIDANKWNGGNMPSQKLTLYAKWNKNSYTVTYKDGDTQSNGVDTVKYNNKVTVRAGLTKDGYTFKGWKSDFDEKTYSAASNFTMPAKNVILTAVWEPVTPTKPETETVDAKYFILIPRAKPTSGADQGSSMYLPNENYDGGVRGAGLGGYSGKLTKAGAEIAKDKWLFNADGVDPNNTYLILPAVTNESQGLGYFDKQNWTEGTDGKYTYTYKGSEDIAIKGNPFEILGQDFDANNIEIVWYVIKNQADGYHVDGYVKGIPITLTYHENFGDSDATVRIDNKTESELLRSGDKVTIENYSTVFTSDATKHESWQFKGWFTKDNQEYKPGETTLINSVDLYARWTKSYDVVTHFMDANGVQTAERTKSNLSGVHGTLLKDMVLPLNQADMDGITGNYVYVPSETKYSVDNKDRGLVGNATFTEANTVIHQYYYLDETGDLGEDEKGNPTDKKDGIPDAWQYKVTFKVVNGSWDNKTNEAIVKYITKKDAAGNNSATGTAKLDAVPKVGNEPNSGYKAPGSWDETPSVGLEIKKDTVFTFTYSRRSSSGGSSRPSTPTVTIPDDVPTGLNGTDHYAYIIGYGNNDVRPQNNITRAEVATIFFRLLTDETREANMTKSNSYNDVKDGDWFCCAVSTLSKMGIIKGYEDGSFKPNDPISRAEFAAIAARFDPDGDKTPASFSDVTSHWAKDEISIAANHGWIKGYEDGSFKPDQKITRAETMTLVNRVLNRLPEAKDDLHKDMKTWVDNMDETAWYYLAVQEATNSHYFKNKTGTKFEQWTDLRDTRDWSELEK